LARCHTQVSTHVFDFQVNNMRKQVEALTKRVDDLDTNIERLDDGSHFLFNFFLDLLSDQIEHYDLMDRFLKDLKRYPATLYPPTPASDMEDGDEWEDGMDGSSSKECFPIQEVDSMFSLDIGIQKLDPWGIIFPKRKTTEFNLESKRNSIALESVGTNIAVTKTETPMDQFDFDDGESLAEEFNAHKMSSDEDEHLDNLKVLQPPKLKLADLMGWTTFSSASEIANERGKENKDDEEWELAEPLENDKRSNQEKNQSCTEEEYDGADGGNMMNIDKIFGFDNVALSDFEDENFEFLDNFKEALDRIKPPQAISQYEKISPSVESNRSDPEPENGSLDTAKPFVRTQNLHKRADSLFNAAAVAFEEEEDSYITVKGKESFEFEHSLKPKISYLDKDKSEKFSKSLKTVYSVRNVKGTTKSEIAKQFVRGDSLKAMPVKRDSKRSIFPHPQEIGTVSNEKGGIAGAARIRESSTGSASAELRKKAWFPRPRRVGVNEMKKHHHHRHKEKSKSKAGENKERKIQDSKPVNKVQTPVIDSLPKLGMSKQKKKERLSTMVELNTDYREYLEQLKQEFSIGKAAFRMGKTH